MVQDGSVKERNSVGTMQSTNGFNSLTGNEGIKAQNKTLNCRICLEEHLPNEQLKQPFVKPCKCSGSLQYVHQSCLLSWLNTMVQKKIENGENLQIIHCQICQEDLSLDYRKRYVWRSCPSIKNLINNLKTHFMLCIGFITFTILSMGAIAYLQKVTKGANPEQDTVLKVIFSIGWILLAISLTIWTIKLFKNYFIKRQIYVSKVESKALVLQIKQRVNSPNQNQPENISQQPKSQEIKKQSQNQMQHSETQTEIVRRKFKVSPVKPAIQNESQDYMQNQIINDNINKGNI